MKKIKYGCIEEISCAVIAMVWIISSFIFVFIVGFVFLIISSVQNIFDIPKTANTKLINVKSWKEQTMPWFTLTFRITIF